MGLTASAYDICDVNQDGKVDVRDVSAISRYLEGNVYVPNYNILDVNKSLTVDHMDEQYVLAKVMGHSYSSSYFSLKILKCTNAPNTSGFTPDSDTHLMDQREYMRYSYTNKKKMTNYKLTPSTTLLSSSSSNNGASRKIIGTDDRFTFSDPVSTGIVNVVGGGQTGTGFIVGDHQIATNAHIVYKDSNWIDSIDVYTYNRNGERTNVKLTATEAHIPKSYADASDGKYDYALITVKEDLSSYVQFDLGTSYNVNESNFSNISIYVTGRPGLAVNNKPNDTNQLYTGEGRVISKPYTGSGSFSNTSKLYYNVDTQPGNSGSPVYTITKNVINNKTSFTYTAIAIHNAGIKDKYNCGPLITKYLLQFYKNNSYANY